MTASLRTWLALASLAAGAAARGSGQPAGRPSILPVIATAVKNGRVR